MLSKRSSPTMEAPQDNIRKRVCKACDRCRLKKSKCDGANPCVRCKADNAICVFGERKKSQDKVYPKGYVEMLEQQQSQLVAGIRELYSRLQKGQGWPGQPLREVHGGHPLTHDILERLDLLHTGNDNSSPHIDGFEEDCNKMQRGLLEHGATYTHRRRSMSPDSDHDHSPPSLSPYSGTPTVKSSPYEPFPRNAAPPTPPSMSSDFQITGLKQPTPAVPLPFPNAGYFESSLAPPTWTTGGIMTMDGQLGFEDKAAMYVDVQPSFDYGNMHQNPIWEPDCMDPARMMPGFTDSNEVDNIFLNAPSL